MRAQFKRPVRIGGKLYECGEHEIDAALADHWYFKALVADGLAHIIDDKPEPKPEPQPQPETKDEIKPATQPAPAKPAPKPAAKPTAKPGKKPGRK